MHGLLNAPIDDFLGPLRVDSALLAELARRFQGTYTRLAAESQTQFLPTPVKEALLRPRELKSGRYVIVHLYVRNYYPITYRLVVFAVPVVLIYRVLEGLTLSQISRR